MSASPLFLSHARGRQTLTYTYHQTFFVWNSGPEWHDGYHDAGPRVRHSRCGRSHVVCRDHEVRHDYPLRTLSSSHIWWPYRVIAKPKIKKLKKLNGQARQIHGILCNSVRHSSNWTHTAVSLFSERPRKGAGEAIDSERAYRTNDKSGMLKVFFYSFRALGRCPPRVNIVPCIQMSTLMGGQVDATEDMFSKLESMRAVITEVNTQFKDPVRAVPGPFPNPRTYCNPSPSGPGGRSTTHRKRRRSSACVYPSSSHCTRRSGSYRS
jgi:hypothetical protein